MNYITPFCPVSMTGGSNVSQSPFSSLAVELKQAIVHELPDIATLQASLNADVSL